MSMLRGGVSASASTKLSPVPDFVVPPAADIRACEWWSPRTLFARGGPPEGDRILAKFVPELLDAFAAQGHAVLDDSDGAVDLMLAFAEIPDGDEPLARRVPERSFPLAFALERDFSLPAQPEHFVTLVSVPERLGGWSHNDVIEAARTAMARIGTPKIVFVSGDRASGVIHEATYCTLEGGHPSDHEDIAERLRDRLVTAACAQEVAGRHEVVEDGLPRGVWQQTPVPDAIVAAGKRMDALDLLPAPKQVSEYVSPELARLYERYLGIKGFSEGMLFAYDADSQTLMLTASGSWDVDKRALRREEVVAIGDRRGGKLQVLAPEGLPSPKGPSVEAWEMYELVLSVPKVRLARGADGEWTVDPDGPVEAPIIRAGIHAHVGVSAADERYIETIPANRELVPYGFGCGTDVMCDVARDSARRSRAIHDPSDPRLYVRWPMLYHGDTVVELWKPDAPPRPLEGLLDLYDPARLGAIDYTPDHIDQPV
jgi:hypothetical protein